MNDRWKRAGLILMAVLIVWNSYYVIPETETAIVTLFGKPVRTVLHAGLYLKWPIEEPDAILIKTSDVLTSSLKP